jgi:CTP synthase (UTP-ammonia lyase)
MADLHPSPSARIALVGDRSPHVQAHVRLPALLEALRRHDQTDLDAYWISTDEITPDSPSLAGFDGIWLMPGSPYRSEAGAVTAVRAAREGAIPFLGTCGGFQHAVLEYARNVCGLATAGHAQNDPDAERPVITALACSLVGHESEVRIDAGSLAERVLGAERTVERYHCSYGLDPAYLDVLTAHGLRFTGHDDEGDVRILELPDHPFFLATLFQPELADTSPRPHPVIRAFAAAAATRAATVAVGR